MILHQTRERKKNRYINCLCTAVWGRKIVVLTISSFKRQLDRHMDRKDSEGYGPNTDYGTSVDGAFDRHGHVGLKGLFQCFDSMDRTQRISLAGGGQHCHGKMVQRSAGSWVNRNIYRNKSEQRLWKGRVEVEVEALRKNIWPKILTLSYSTKEQLLHLLGLLEEMPDEGSRVLVEVEKWTREKPRMEEILWMWKLKRL